MVLVLNCAINSYKKGNPQSKRSELINKCRHLKKYALLWHDSRVFLVSLYAVFVHVSSCTVVWLMFWIALWTRHESKGCKW